MTTRVSYETQLHVKWLTEALSSSASDSGALFTEKIHTVTAPVDLEGITLREASQAEELKHRGLSPVCTFLKMKITKPHQTHRKEGQLVVTGGGGGAGGGRPEARLPPGGEAAQAMCAARRPQGRGGR